MKGKIIEVQIFNDATTLYMCYGVDSDDICYFICLEDGYPVNKYIKMTKDQLKDRKNKKDHYRYAYCEITNGEQFDMFRFIRNKII